jgi:hypothetical protein
VKNSRPVERKVYASTIGAGVGLTVSNFALWAADTLWWPAESATVPEPVAAFVELVVTIGLAFLGGYLAKHDPGYTEIDEPPLPDV